MSAGQWALMRCVRGFRPEKGFRFSTYAYRSILRAMWHVIDRAPRPMLSLDQERGDSDGGTFKHVLRAPVGRTPERMDGRWTDLLDERQALILRMRADGRTLEQIGMALGGLSRERVRQKLVEIEALIRAPARAAAA